MIALQRSSAAMSVTADDPKALLLKAGRSRIEQTSAMAYYHDFLEQQWVEGDENVFD